MDCLTQAITCNAVSAVMLCMLLLNFIIRFKTEKDDMKVFFVMILVNLFQCVVEPITLVLDGKMFPGAVTLSTVLNSLLFIGNIAFATLWATYADLRLEVSSRKPSLVNFLKFFPAMLVVLGAIANLFTPVFFRITEDNWYQRTELFLPLYFVSYGYLITGMVISYGFGRRSQRYVFLPAVTFLAPVFIASILQFLFYGISVLWVGSAIGLTSAYVSLLNERAEVDSPIPGIL